MVVLTLYLKRAGTIAERQKSGNFQVELFWWSWFCSVVATVWHPSLVNPFNEEKTLREFWKSNLWVGPHYHADRHSRCGYLDKLLRQVFVRNRFCYKDTTLDFLAFNLIGFSFLAAELATWPILADPFLKRVVWNLQVLDGYFFMGDWKVFGRDARLAWVAIPQDSERFTKWFYSWVFY